MKEFLVELDRRLLPGTGASCFVPAVGAGGLVVP